MRLKLLNGIKKNNKIMLLAVYSICICCSIISCAFMKATDVLFISVISLVFGILGNKYLIFMGEVNRKIWGTKRTDEKYLRQCADRIIGSMAAVVFSIVYYVIYIDREMSILVIYVAATIFSENTKYAIKCMDSVDGK